MEKSEKRDKYLTKVDISIKRRIIVFGKKERAKSLTKAALKNALSRKTKRRRKMKKFLAMALVLAMAFTLTACTASGGGSDVHKKSEGTMTYEDYMAADLESEVVIEAFVQAKQSWWEDKATVYAQDKDGGYFLYNMACSEEDYDKLTKGAKIKVTGYKAEWSGEVEIIDASFEIMDGTWVAEASDVTSLLGKDELIKQQNKFVSFKGLTVEASKDANGAEVPFLYNWDGSGSQGDDVYFNASIDGQTYQFTIESYLTGADTDVYKAAEALNIGDTVDMEGFLYWYEGVNPHITSIKVK